MRSFPQILYVTGLPRAGSTLLCQLLDLHPEIYSTGHSSPLRRVPAVSHLVPLHPVPAHIARELKNYCRGYYEAFYLGLLNE